MTRNLTLFLLACALLCSAGTALAQLPGTITSLTVYRGQALVTRHITTTLAAGDQEVVITQLPEQTLPTSLYATAEGGLTIRSVRFRSRAVTDEPRAEVQQLDAEITAAQSQLRRIDADTAVLKANADFLDKLAGFVTPTASMELSKGVLNPEALTKTSEFIFTQRATLSKQQLTLNEEKLGVTSQLDVLQRNRAKLMAGAGKTVREAVVFVTQEAAGPAAFNLSYLVNGADWTPAYAAYLKGDRSKLELAYHAVVTQASGEDWKDVKLTLSTTRPLMTAETPVISPMMVALSTAGGTPNFTDTRQYLNARNDLERQVKGSEGLASQTPTQQSIGMPMFNMPPNPGLPAPAPTPENEVLNRNLLAARAQNLELAVSDEAVKLLGKTPTSTQEVLAVTYELPGKVSLASREDQQMFRITLLKLDATFYYTVVPLITNFVYQAVEARNAGATPLLPGPYSAYLDGQFAGRGNLPLVAAGQTLAIGFGTETQLRAARELTDKTTEIRGGNKLVKYTYRLRLSNFMDRSARVRVWDRYPQATDINVAIKLLKTEPGTSQDAFYVAEEAPRGLLRWDVDVPAGSVDTKTVNISYAFTMEYDKTFNVAEPTTTVTQQMEQEFNDLQLMRFNSNN